LFEDFTVVQSVVFEVKIFILIKKKSVH